MILKLIFNNNLEKSINIETDFYYNTKFMNLKRFLQYHFDDFIDKGYEFFYIEEMNIITVDDKKYMSFKYYSNQPMSMLERRINVIYEKNLYF